MTRAVLYARVSTEKQSREGVSLEVQEQLARERCEREGWELGGVYLDVMSGRSDKRPEFARLQADAQARRFEVVIVYRTDRLARSTLKLLQVAAALQDHGISLVSLTENLDMTTAYGRLVFQLLAAVGELESANTGARVRDAMRHRAATTGRHIGVTPDGYRRTGDGALEPDPDRAAIVLEAFERYADGGSLRATCMALNSRGLLSLTGRQWRSSNLRQILRNPVYVGRLAYGRHEVKRDSQGKIKKRLRAEGASVVVEAAHPAIIPLDLWERCQARLKERSGVPARLLDGQAKHPWSGLLRCGLCGGAMHFNTHHSGWDHYRCNLRSNGGCRERMLSVGLVALNRNGLGVLNKTLAGAVAVAAANGVTPKKRSRPDERTTKAAALQAAIKAEADLYRARAQSFEEMEARVAELNAELAALERAPAPDRPPAILPPVADMVALWERLAPAKQGELLRALVDHVTVLPDRCVMVPRSEYRWCLGDAIEFPRTTHRSKA